MNIDDKIMAKIESIDKKMKDSSGIDLLKLQSCARELQHMGPIGMRTGHHETNDEAIDKGSRMIEKLMLLQSLNIFEESIAIDKKK